MPVTRPEVLTVAIDELLLLHAPPDTGLLKVAVVAAHTIGVPDIVPAVARALTVTARVAVAAPQPLVTV